MITVTNAWYSVMNKINPISRQRFDGAQQIAEYALDLAEKAGIKLDRAPVWDNGDAMRERVNHTLQLSANGRARVGTFPDEWLKDYPGVAGTEVTRARVCEMIYGLSQ